MISEKFSFYFLMFFGRGDKNKKLGNGLKLSLLLWIIFLQVRFKFMCEQNFCIILLKKKIKLWLLFMGGVQLSQGYIAFTRRQFTFYYSVPRSYRYSFNRPWKNERLSWPWSHPVVLNLGPLDWESSALTTRPFPNNYF